jgi:F-type H+-transporting ATPase subunit delta
MSTLGLDFIQLSVQNKREEYLPGMAMYFIELYKAEKGIKIATILSAVAIDDSSAGLIKDMVKSAFKSEIELKQEIKKELIGGFVLRVEDRQLDASVKGKLARIKKELKQ